ncbi:hypothetical protein CFIO01_12775 [Colletotrichum fioriniae PJ7]|uniref:Uncharacterized protein n=1 Tax=Colletotrichum fioriniae PJ7 TaxID=1445577 RepID=A0A010QIM9_9PEZI|nr:hypothetical protein CFIO01_12775 [Colletotrichum fioriniae PJ7]
MSRKAQKVPPPTQYGQIRRREFFSTQQPPMHPIGHWKSRHPPPWTLTASTAHAPAASHTSKVEGRAPLVAAELHTKIPGISKSVARADHSRPNKRADPVAFRQRDSFAASPHPMT